MRWLLGLRRFRVGTVTATVRGRLTTRVDPTGPDQHFGLSQGGGPRAP